jgi:omega-hydroxypalmitate O-feruloyl transferase
MKMKVTRSEPVLVHASGDAAATVAEEYYFLSNLDQNVAVPMKTVHVFTSSADNAAALMRESLSRVLPSYYPFQGALAVRPDGRLAVRNGRRGVPFVEASADGELRQVTDGSVSAPGAAEALADLVYTVGTDDGETDREASSLLTVQVTTFKCGGLVLGLSMNHCLADGQSAAEFLRSWAEVARGLPLSTSPFLDRTLQSARPVPTIVFPHDEFAEIEDVSGLAGMFGGDDDPFVYRSFTFDAGKLESLKKAASDGDGAGAAASATTTTTCSTFVALTAFVWVARTRALRMRPEQRSKLLFAVDGRRRVDPPLPRGFWGNAVVFACCIADAGDLLGRPLSAAARSIQDAIARTDDAFIRSAVDYIERNRGARPSLTATTLLTAWNRLGLDTADFGWGQAVHSGPAELPQKEVVMILGGGRDSQSKVLVIGLPLSCVQTFEEMVDQM